MISNINNKGFFFFQFSDSTAGTRGAADHVAASEKAVKAAYDRGSKGISDAAAANTKAVNAQTAADNAATAATAAQSSANAAQTTANSAVSAANTAQNTANSAKTAAQNAQNTANSASSAANTAKAICTGVWGYKGVNPTLPNYGTWRVLYVGDGQSNSGVVDQAGGTVVSAGTRVYYAIRVA